MTDSAVNYPLYLKRLGLPAAHLTIPVQRFEASANGVLHDWRYCRGSRTSGALDEVSVNALTRRGICRRCRTNLIAPGAHYWAYLVEALGTADAELREVEANATSGGVAAQVTFAGTLATVTSRIDRAVDLFMNGTVESHSFAGVDLVAAMNEAVDRLRSRIDRVPGLVEATARQRRGAAPAALSDALAADVAWAETYAIPTTAEHGMHRLMFDNAITAWRAAFLGVTPGEGYLLDLPTPAQVNDPGQAQAAFRHSIDSVERPYRYGGHDLPGPWLTAPDGHPDGFAWTTAEWEARRDAGADHFAGLLETTRQEAATQAATPAVVLVAGTFPTERGNDLLLAGRVLGRDPARARLVVATTELGARWLSIWSKITVGATTATLAVGDDVFDEDVAGSFLTIWQDTYHGYTSTIGEALAVARAVAAD